MLMVQPTYNVEAAVLALPRDARIHLVLKLLDSIEERPLADPTRCECAGLKEANRPLRGLCASNSRSLVTLCF